MAYLLRESKGAKKLSNAQYLNGGESKQVLSMYHIISNVAYLLWKYVKGYSYSSDGKAMKTSDDKYFKFKDQD